MKDNQIKILAIESSCDETAAAVIGVASVTEERKNQATEEQSNHEAMKQSCVPAVLSNIVSSQIELHAKTGGVVPEVASRAHLESIIPVIEQALQRANPKFEFLNSKQSQNSIESKSKEVPDLLQGVTHIAVTVGPGLIGSLLVGFNTAKSLAYALDIPVIPINHIEGHIYSAFTQNRITNNLDIPLRSVRFEEQAITKSLSSRSDCHSGLDPESCNRVSGGTELKKLSDDFTIEQFKNELKFPILALTVSGGHTSLTLMRDHGEYDNIGSTLDDAAGEAFDKVAKLLDLGYPGGPAVSRYAAAYREKNPKSVCRNPNKIPKLKLQNIIPSALPGGQADEESHNRVSGNNNGKNITAVQHNTDIHFPRPLLDQDNFNFSFSGLKTSVLYTVQKIKSNCHSELDSESNTNGSRIPPIRRAGKSGMINLTEELKEQICFEFEEAVVDVLVGKTLKACEKYKPKAVILAGGVAANFRLREVLNYQLKANNYPLILPPAELCGDNAAMIGTAAFYHILRGDTKSWGEIKVDSNLKL